MSAFDDLLNFGDSSETAQGTDPFDPFAAPQLTNQNAGNSSGDLLDLGFDSQVSAENGSSGKVNFEANTNPLYEFTNSESKMASDSTNPLYEFNNEPVQKDLKSEPSNLLYEYMQNEGTTNGHVEDGLSNGREQEVDLLGGGDLMGGDTENVDNSGDLLENSGGGDVMDETTENVEDSRDFQENSQPVIPEDFGETADESKPSVVPEGEETQERSRSSSESSVPEQEKEENAQNLPEQVSEQVEISETELPEQASGPLDEGPKVGEKESSPVDNCEDKVEGNNEAGATTEVLDEGTSEVKADVESDEPQETGQASEENQNIVSEEVVEQTGTKVEGLDTEQEESKVEEKNIDVEEQLPVDDQDSNPCAELDKPENIESAVESEPDAAVEDEQVTQVEAEPALEVSNIPEEATSVNTIEPEKSDNVEETVPLESVDKETDSINDELVPHEKIEEVVAEELEPEKLDSESMPEQTSTEVPANEEPEVVDEVKTNTKEKELEPEQPPQMVEPEQPPQMVESEQPPQMVETEQPPQMVEPEKKPDTTEIGDEEEVAVPKSPQDFNETRNSIPDENALKVNGTSEISENGVSEEDAVRDPNIFRETHEKEEVHFAEMNNVRQKFESGRTNEEEQTPRRISVKEEYDQGGEFENEPVQNPDVVKETDQPKEELPEIGMAKNLVNRFKSIQEEKAQPVVSQKRQSPPRTEKVEYESQPAEHLPQYEAKVEAGVFESEPKGRENVVRSGEQAEDYKPEQGYAKNIMNKFKEIQTETSQYKSHEKRELTPDRSGKVEYVSEPRGEKIIYDETKTESGVFENVPKEEEDVVRSGDKADEVLPESGMAKSLLSKFKQMETEVGNRPPPSPVKEATEWSYKKQVSHEQKGYLERYEPQTEAGEFENQPVVRPEVVRSGEQAEEILPEVGTAKKTMERFKEIQKQSSSPVSSKHKEITPPREHSPGRNVAGVFESTPKERGDVIKSGEAGVEELPEQGTTRNILNKFKEIQSSGSQSGSPGKKQKEFTPPPESGVYENKPKEHLVIESRTAESGILESTPSKSQADVAREREATPESDLPEQGMAKNLVSRWKQLESASGSAKSTSSTSPRFKEFTPPRDSRGPLSPKSPAGVTNGVHPSELPGQYQPQESSVIYENKPEVKEGVYREADTDWTEGMPAPNTTSSMLQRFKSMQEEAKASEVTPEPVHRKEKGMFKVVQTEKCAACQKTVYAMEKLEMNGHIYHKNCFKCSHCSARLTPKTFSMNEGVIYCVNHFKQLFARKGNYDEGFGRQQYKKKWQGDKSEGATA